MPPQPEPGPAPRWRGVAVGLLIGFLALIVTTSYVSVVFSGPLAPFRDFGMSMALFGATLYALAGAFATSVPGTWWGNQSAPLVMTTIGVAGTVGALPASASEADLLATAAAFIMAATLLSGLALFLVGSLRLGTVVKFIPYPVVGGFLAATGVYLVLNGAGLALPGGLTRAALLDPNAASGWLPYVAGGAAMVLLARRLSHATALFVGIAVFLLLFYGHIALSGQTLLQAQAEGLLLGASPKGLMGLAASDLPRLGGADLGAIAGQGATLLALVALSLLALVMNVSGLELAGRVSFDLDREMRNAGLANMLGAAGGAFVGFHSVSMQQVSSRLLPAPHRVVNLAGAAVTGLGLLGALWFVEWLPVGVFALVLCFIGGELVWRWLVTAWYEMPRGDYALVLLILGVTLAFDFVTAVIVGVIAASVLFTVAYSRVRVIRSKATGRLRQSPTERPERDIATLTQHGARTVVFELQGFLFFGTANPLFDAIAAELPETGPQVRHLILDFRRVDGMDVSTAYVIGRIVDMARRRSARVAFSGLSRKVAEQLAVAGSLISVDPFDALADALGWAEERILAEHGEPGKIPPVTAFGNLLRDAERAGLALVDQRRVLAAGDTLYRQGDPGDSLAYIKEGRLSAWVRRPEGTSARVASFLPGAIVGEIAFSNGAARTASIVADTPCRLVIVSRTSLDRAVASHPEIAARFHALLARLLSDRLGRTTALLHVLDR